MAACGNELAFLCFQQILVHVISHQLPPCFSSPRVRCNSAAMKAALRKTTRSSHVCVSILSRLAVQRSARKIASAFSDAVKSEDSLLKLLEMKDNNIFKGLRVIAAAGARSCRVII